MRVLLFTAFLAVGAWTASTSAQVGLYGSPDMVNLPQAESGSAAVPASYSSTWSTRAVPQQPAPGAMAQPAAQQPVYAPAIPVVAQPTYPMTAQPGYAPAMPVQAIPQAAYAPQAVYAPQQQPAPQAPYVYAPRQAAPPVAYAQPNPAYGTPNPPKAPAAPTMPAVPEPPLQPQPAPTANMVDQMLMEPAGCGAAGGAGCAGGATGGGVYSGCGTDYSAMAQAAAGECGTCGYSPWYASIAGLALARNDANRFYWSADAMNSSHQAGLTYESWRGGIEARFGRRFCYSAEGSCLSGMWSLEATYWTVVGGFEGERVVRFPGGVVTPIALNHVQFYNTLADQPMATDIIDGAVEHRIRRDDQIHNVEINLFREGMLCDPCNPLDVNWGIGLRFFRFDEHLVFGALHQGTWGADPTQEAYINIRDENNLLGCQFTVDLNYYLSPNWRVFVTPRVGIYANHIEQNFQVYRGDGVVGSSDDPQLPGRFPVRSRTDALSFLTQLDVGVNWSITRNWGVALGYRAVVATGIGLSDNQVPPYLVDMPEIGHIDYNGELILHGAFASVTYNF